MQRKCDKGQRYKHLEGAALECAFLDPVDLEDRHEECQVNEVAQERPQAAPARFGLARVQAAIRPCPGSWVVFGHGRYCWCSARLGLVTTEFCVSAPMGPPPSRLNRSTGVASNCRDSAG